MREIPATIQVFDEAKLEQSTAISVTDFLAENAVGFFSEWTPGQTSINLRGAATDGQGRDFRSQVVVLVNGRRAGTANLSKLSLKDVHRIEVVRGPASVIYGNQALGGVINLIMRSGENTSGNSIAATVGSWGRVEGSAYLTHIQGSWDFYLSVHGGRRSDYAPGEAAIEDTLRNTAYERLGGLFSVAYNWDTGHRMQLDFRSDGIYDAGFRGSAYDVDNQEDRYNHSLDLTYTGHNEKQSVRWQAHYYFFHDVDDFEWGTEVVRSGVGLPVPGFDVDNNRRVSNGHGLKLFTDFDLFTGNVLLAGIDLEASTLRSERFRSPAPGNATLTQVAPFDNNTDSRNFGVYVEDSQKLFNDRITLRGGVRYDYGEQALKQTPNQPLLVERTEAFDSVTYSSGVTFGLTDSLTWRGGASTGFRAPTGTELAADFTSVLGGQTIGNPDLKPERSLNFETGFTFASGAFWADAAWFHNTIDDRITTVPIAGGRTQWVNGTEAVVQGLELQTSLDMARLTGLPGAWSIYANGAYHYEFDDKSPAALASNSDKVQRMYEYQATVGTSFGSPGKWDARIYGVLRGPMYYDTEENLLVPGAEPNRNFVHRKSPFWVLNTKARYFIRKDLNLWFGVNNLLDVNEHPIFIAINQQPNKADPAFSNGGLGNSMAGREFLGGLEWRF